MELSTATRIATLALLVLLGSSAAQAQQPATETVYTVPTDTRDPVLVERGVREWLHRHEAEYPPFRQAAILRRMRQESGYHPCIGSGPHHHLLQWRDSRLFDLYKHAGVRYGICPPWLAQVRYMNWELTHVAHYSRFMRSTPRDAYWVFSTVYLGGRAG